MARTKFSGKKKSGINSIKTTSQDERLELIRQFHESYFGILSVLNKKKEDQTFQRVSWNKASKISRTVLAQSKRKNKNYNVVLERFCDLNQGKACQPMGSEVPICPHVCSGNQCIPFSHAIARHHVTTVNAPKTSLRHMPDWAHATKAAYAAKLSVMCEPWICDVCSEHDDDDNKVSTSISALCSRCKYVNAKFPLRETLKRRRKLVGNVRANFWSHGQPSFQMVSDGTESTSYFGKVLKHVKVSEHASPRSRLNSYDSVPPVNAKLISMNLDFTVEHDGGAFMDRLPAIVNSERELREMEERLTSLMRSQYSQVVATKIAVKYERDSETIMKYEEAIREWLSVTRQLDPTHEKTVIMRNVLNAKLNMLNKLKRKSSPKYVPGNGFVLREDEVVDMEVRVVQLKDKTYEMRLYPRSILDINTCTVDDIHDVNYVSS
jgi:hypothetical protein